MSEPNVYQRIAAVRKDVGYLRKDKTVEVKTRNGSFAYQAVTHDAVAAAIREPMEKHGVVTIPRVVKHERIPTGSQGAFMESVHMEIDFINTDNPDDRFTVPTFAFGMDFGDKAPGKAISMAVKYCYLKTFNIETGEDEESRVAPPPKPISEEKAADLDVLIDEVDADRDGFFEYFGIQKLSDLPANRYREAVKMLEKKRAGS